MHQINHLDSEQKIGLKKMINQKNRILVTVILNIRVDKSSTTKIDNRKKDILILRKSPTQGLEHTLSAENMYSISFIKENTSFA